MGTLWQDLRYGFRMLARNPGFTAVAVLTLALGIGANTTIFSVVNAILLRPLPYPEADRLVRVWQHSPGSGFPLVGLSEFEWTEYRQHQHSFEGIAVYFTAGANLTGQGEALRVNAAVVSANFFSVLGVEPGLGRAFTPEEDTPGNDQVIVLEHGFWQRRFGSDPDVVGQAVVLNGRKQLVVGVMPPGFAYPPGEVDLWVPIAIDTANLNSSAHYLSALARIKPGETFEQASAEFNNLALQQLQEYPDRYPQNAGWGGHLVRLHESLVGAVRPALLVLLAAVGLVLLVACANVANLLLARGVERKKEIAIRMALGASRVAIMKQLLTEGVLLALMGGATGLLLAAWSVDFLPALLPEGLLNYTGVGIDLGVLAFTLVVSIVTVVLFGVVPAWQTSNPDLHVALKEGGRSSNIGGHRRLRHLLVVSEVALSLVLLIGAGLLAKSLSRLLDVDQGFRTENILTFRVSLPAARYDEAHKVTAFYRELFEKLGGLPGVTSAGGTQHLPLGGTRGSWRLVVDGLPPEPGSPIPYARVEADLFSVSPGYFDAIGMEIVKGRGFRESDTLTSPRAVVVDELFVRRFWPGGEEPLGKKVDILQNIGDTPNWRTIVGVVRHAKHYGPAAKGREQVYFPYTQRPVNSMFATMRTAGESRGILPTVRSQVASLDPDLPIYNLRTMEQRLAQTVAQPRFTAWLLSIFALLAVVLASVGLYGVISYSVSRRTHEIGIRMALGAQPHDILKLVVGQGMVLTLAGVGVGLAASFALTRFLESLLFGVSATDPATFTAVSVLLAAVALLACYIPARRATKIDPMVALRYE